MGVAVRGGRNILVVYADWRSRSLLVNGRRQWPRHGRRYCVGNLCYSFHGNWFVARYKGAIVRAATNPWWHSRYMDLYVRAPWNWSSGRSMTGMCGNYDGNAANDRSVFGLARNYYVLGNFRRSMFRNPRARLTELQTSLAVNEEEDIEDAKWSSRAKGADKFTEKGKKPAAKAEKAKSGFAAANAADAAADAADAAAAAREKAEEKADRDADAAEARKIDEFKTKQKRVKGPTKNFVIPKDVKVSKATIRKARKGCAHLFGAARKECVEDALAGEPVKEAAAAAKEGEVQDSATLLSTCVPLDQVNSGTYNADRFKRPKTNQGYTFAFWYQPKDPRAHKERRSVMSKGNELDVSVKNGKLRVTVAGKSCDSKKKLSWDEWTQITIATSSKGVFTLYINGEKQCSKNSGQEVINKEALVIGKKGMKPAIGHVAHLYYAPLNVNAGPQLKEFTSRRPPASCKA